MLVLRLLSPHHEAFRTRPLHGHQIASPPIQPPGYQTPTWRITDHPLKITSLCNQDSFNELHKTSQNNLYQTPISQACKGKSPTFNHQTRHFTSWPRDLSFRSHLLAVGQLFFYSPACLEYGLLTCFFDGLLNRICRYGNINALFMTCMSCISIDTI